MKLVLKMLVLAVLTGVPISKAAANTESSCSDKKSFLISEVRAAIATHPNSCRSPMIHFECDVLFKSKLPQLVGVIARNEFTNLRQIVDFVNNNRPRIANIVADQYTGSMYSLIGDLNSYLAHWFL